MLSTSICSCRAFVSWRQPSTCFISQFSSSLVNPCFITNSGAPWKSNPARRMSVSATKAVSLAQSLKDAEELINSVETFIFDCDGVIWKGDKLIDGVPSTLGMLRSKEDGGKKIELKPGFLVEHDKDVGAVVVGFDWYFNYYKVQR